MSKNKLLEVPLMKLMTNNRLIALMDEVIATHSLPILKELGLENNNDGILDRISASSQVGESTPHGTFDSDLLSKGFRGMQGVSYVEGSGSITLYPLMLKIYKKGNGNLVSNPISSVAMGLFTKTLKKYLIFILAHELRHYWQYYTNIVFTKGDYIGSSRFTPYSDRWEEKDANEWAKTYITTKGRSL